MTKILRDSLRHLALVAMLATFGTGAALATEQTVLLYGDSLMAGLGLPPEDGFAARLQDALGPEVRVLNTSVSGDTSASGLARIDWSLSERPDAVLLELGANDMLQGLPVDEMRANLTALLERFKTDGVPVLLVGMRASPSLGSDYVAAYDAVFPTLAAEYNVPLYPFFLDGVALDRGLNQADGMHPNADGVARIVEGIVPEVKTLLSNAAR